MTTLYLTHPRYPEHDIPGHPERPERIHAVWQTLEKKGLLQCMQTQTAHPVTDAQINRVHTDDYLAILNEVDTAYQSGDRKTMYRLDNDTYLLTVTPEIARLAAGGAVDAVGGVLSGKANNALAAVRPPGHHALPERGMGFCLLGNIAIAARYAQNVHGLKRILVVDFDVHHGNGTEAMFYDDSSVMFISTHQSPFYPGTGAVQNTGTNAGTGYTVNIPLTAGSGDQNYARIFAQIVWPIAHRYQPQLILVSAGFDAHWVDPLASMNLTLSGLAHLTRELVKMANTLCDGKIVFVMEGGYDTEALAHGIANIAHALLGEDEISDPLGAANHTHEPEIAPLLQTLQELHGL